MNSPISGYLILAGIAFVLLAILAAAIWAIRFAWKAGESSPAMKAGAFLGIGCLMMMVAGCPILLFPVFKQAKEAAKRTACLANLNQLSRAMQMYAGDISDRLPQSNWCDALIEYVYDVSAFTCPALDEPFGYTYNRAIVGKRVAEIESPATTPLVFDGPGGANSIGDLSLVKHRHLEKACLGYLKGPAVAIASED